MPIDARLLPRRQVLRLLEEAGEPIVARPPACTPKRCASSGGDFDHRQRGAGAAFEVEAQHARVVHLVDVIAGQHDQVPRLLALDRVEVLVDGVGGALVPVLADPLLRVQHLDELAELVGDDAPAEAQVAGQRQRLVLQRDEDLAQPRVEAVAEGEVDDPVGAAEIDRRLGAFLRQRRQALADASGQHHDDDVVQHVESSALQHDARRGAVGAGDAQRQAVHLVLAGLGLREVQPFDDDDAVRRAGRVRRRARLS